MLARNVVVLLGSHYFQPSTHVVTLDPEQPLLDTGQKFGV
jgi:hypothetical protein